MQPVKWIGNSTRLELEAMRAIDLYLDPGNGDEKK